MAEETAPVAGEEVIAPPEEQTSSETQLDPIETLAWELGWRPKEKFRGEPEEWKPATDFIREGRDVQRSLTRELRSVRDEVSRMGRVSSKILADKLAEKDAELEARHRRAVEEGDVQGAEKAADERFKLKQQAPAEASGELPETQAFRERHKTWFGVNRLATGRAMEIAERSRQLGATPAEQLQDAEAAVRREFPELFPQPAKPPASVQTATTRNADGARGKRGFADMPQASQDMARDYLRRHGIPLDKFAESYWADPANQERKVG